MNMKTGYGNMALREGEMTTCILNEGILIFDEENDSFSFKSQIGIDDVVELDTKTDNTYDQYYIPFVQKCKQSSPFDVGIVISKPRWQSLPLKPKTIHDWVEIRKNQYYRLAVVYLSHPIAVTNNRYRLTSQIIDRVIYNEKKKRKNKMLTESGKKTVIWMCKCGKSYEEIAQTILDTRNHFVFNELRKEIEAYIKERDQ